VSTNERTGPLAHVRVLDLSRLYPGAFCTSLLADLGADVVKVEAPGFGDGLRTMTPEPFKAGHVALNRGKRSLSLDLKAPGAADVLRRLVVGVDVLVESHRPGALEQMELGYDDLAALNPGLIWCSLTGFGSDGPLALAAGHDITYTGYSGVLERLVEPGVAPPVPQITLSLQPGALMGVVGILSAYAQRSVTGRGARIDASLVDSAMWSLAEDVARAASAPAPGWPAMASRATYRCADDRYVTVASSEPRTWAAMCAALEVAELAEHRMGVDEPAAIARLARVFATKDAATWLTNPGLAGGVGPVHTPADLLVDPHLAARGAITTLDGTDTKVLANPLRMRGADGVATTATAPPPEIGQHTDEVLAEHGFTPAETAALRDAKVI
jgi:alpha-methylacyl-CoA racemase